MRLFSAITVRVVGAVVIAALLIGLLEIQRPDSYLRKIEQAARHGILLDKAGEVFRRFTVRLTDMWYAHSESDDWSVESQSDRSRLQEYRVIPASRLGELTPATVPVGPADFETWRRSHGNSDSTRYSSLNQINHENVHELEVAWGYRTEGSAANIQATPVIDDGLLYFPNAEHSIVALEPSTGIEVWSFSTGHKYPAKRGMVIWKGDSSRNARLYFPAGHALYAIDAKSGESIEEFGGGSVALGAESRVAPAIAGHTIVVPVMGAAVHGLDARTGRRLWTTDLIPEFLPDGPDGRPSKQRGSNPWGGIAVDESRRIAYVATGNPSPVLVGVERPGTNPYSVSVVAIDVDDGSILWDFQEIAHDLWDLDLPASPILTSIERNGKAVDVVVAVSKAGNTLLLDRVTGKPVFDFRLRRAPASRLPGERTAPYQPDLELPEPFAKQAFTLEDVTDISPEANRYVLSVLQSKNFGFYAPHEEGVDTVYFGLHGGAEWPGASVDPRVGALFVASSHVPSLASVMNTAMSVDEDQLPASRGRRVYLDKCSSCHGRDRSSDSAPDLTWLDQRFSRTHVKTVITHGMQAMPPVPMENSDMTALIEYLYTRDYELRRHQHRSRRSGDYRFTRTQYRRLVDHEGYPGSKPPWGTLNRINLNSGVIEWRVPLGEIPELMNRGVPVTGTENISGPLATAGNIVFVSGTKDRLIRAFDSHTGAELWRWELPFIGSAPPMTYIADGRQFVVIPATGGGTLKLYDDAIEVGDAIVAFALPLTRQ